jgi:hypothetical protein
MLNHTNLSIPPAPGTAKKNICMEVYDRLQQKSSQCMDITMDFSPPRLLNASLWLGSSQLKYTKGEPMGNIRLEAYISEDSALNISSIVADFSSLNTRPEFSNFYKNIDITRTVAEPFRGNCSNVSEGLYKCVWAGLLILIPAGASPSVSIAVYDNLSNFMNSSYNIPIVFDNTRPAITAIRSGIADDRGRYWVGAGNNTIYVDILETGSGMADKKLYLDFSSFGQQQYAGNKVVIAPNNCTEGWTCIFDLINIKNIHNSGDLLSVSVSASSVDAASNMVEGVTTAGFYYDKDAPQIISIQNSSICPTFPDSIDITINVSERYSGGVRGEVSAPDLSTDFFPQEFDCEQTETAGIWTCDVSINNLVTIYTKSTVNITLIDRAGNRNTTALSQEVCEAAPGTPPNVVKVTKCDVLPATGIDRQISERIPFPIFLRPTFSTAGSSTSIQDVKVNGCFAEYGELSDTYILDELNFVNPLVGTKVKLSSAGLNTSAGGNIESMDITCELEMIVRAGTKVYQQAEMENFTCEDVPLHGTVFGGINASLNATLNDLAAQIRNKEDEISDYEDWVDVLGAICTIAQLVVKITMALEMLREVLWLALLIPYLIPQLRNTVDSFFKSTCRIIEYISGYVSTLLWNVDSDIIFTSIWGGGNALKSTGFYIKLLCGIMTCQLTEKNTWVELIGGTVGWESSPYGSDSYSKFVEGTESMGEDNVFPQGDESDPTSIPGDVYKVIFSAYRCKEMSVWGLCLPGYLYALRKERQLLCMKRNCYRDYVSAGFSPYICDWMHSGRQCLYVTSAAYKVSGDSVAGRIAQGIVEYLLVAAANSGISIGLRELGCAYPWGINNWDNIGSGVDAECGQSADSAATSTASDDAEEPEPPAFGDTDFISKWKHHVCGLILATTMWMDVGDWLDGSDWDWNYYNKGLEDPDYCSM